MVLTHTKRMLQEVLRFIQSGNISDKCADYLQYKCEGAISILNISSLIYNIPVTFVDQAEEIFIMVEEALREIQQISQSSAFHIENAFSGSPRYPALNDPREVLKMSVENKCNVKYHGMHVKSEWINCEKMTPFKWDINFFSICKLKQRWFRHYRGRYTSTVPKKWLQAHNWLSLSKGI